MSDSDVLAGINAAEVISFLRGLVAIRTETPPGNERPAADYLAARLRPLGFEIELFEPAPERTSLIATLAGTGGGPTLILNGHTDTKPARPAIGSAEEWRYDPWEGGVEGNLIYGNGAADMKAGVSAAVLAAEAVVRSGRRLKGNLMIQAVADEEGGSGLGQKAMVSRGFTADWAIVAEPTEMEISIAQLGSLWVTAETTGEMGHGSQPYRYVNAIEQMLKVIDAERAVTEERRRRHQHPLFPHHPTMNLGVITGGIHPGMVADRCRLTVDFRLLPGERQQAVFEALKAEMVRRQQADPKLKVDLSIFSSGGLEPNEIAADSPVVAALAKASQRVRGREPAQVGLTGATDAAVLTASGIPSVVFGPGSLQRAHKVNEYVEADQVVDCTKVFALTILDLVG